MKLFKLTNVINQTYNITQWGQNFTHSIPKEKQKKKMCSSGIIHAYKNFNLALLLNPIHSGFIKCKAWEAEGNIVLEDWGKVGVWKLTTLKQLDLPDWYTRELTKRRVQIQFAILCAEKVLQHFEKIYPEDQRPRKAIQFARDFLETTEIELNNIIDVAARDDVYDVAHGAALAASGYTDAIDAARAAGYAACTVSNYSAANAAANAAAHAHNASDKINFSKLADKAVSLENRKEAR